MSNYVHGGSDKAIVDLPLVPADEAVTELPDGSPVTGEAVISGATASEGDTGGGAHLRVSADPQDGAQGSSVTRPTDQPSWVANRTDSDRRIGYFIDKDAGEGKGVPNALVDLEAAHLAIDTEVQYVGKHVDRDWGELSDEAVVEQLRDGEFLAFEVPPSNFDNLEREYELVSDREAIADSPETGGIFGLINDDNIPLEVLNHNPDLVKDIAELTGQYGTHRSALLPILEGLRDRRHQINDVAMQLVAERLGISVVDVEGVVTFYHFLGVQPTGKHVIHVCRTISCALQGMTQVVQRLERETGMAMDETTADGLVTLEWANCIGLCDQAPAILVDREAVGPVTPDQAASIITMLRA
ncbi:MAG: NAD(P)H-dependent oxidoreductase subunit E [Cellulomonadaceae bacterium]|jgi:NADH:ubiquinone oxidoreductase subunit E|nr:NAD(P)H-dependent oxidoreductase subunit E [Cellulomonadaceae bacterium]